MSSFGTLVGLVVSLAATLHASAGNAPRAETGLPHSIDIAYHPGGGGSASVRLGVSVVGGDSIGHQIADYTREVGARPSIVMWFQDWEPNHPWAMVTRAELEGARAARVLPVVTWSPWVGRFGDPRFSLKSIVDGTHDSYIHRAAIEVGAWGRPVFIRLAPEMNGSYYPWGVGVNGNTPRLFIAAWRHVVTLFRRSGASNVRWVWAPNVVGSGTATEAFPRFYPGDKWVTWVALDGYNAGTTRGNSWESFRTVFGSSYRAMLHLTSKPLIIAETGSAEAGGSKAEWIRNAYGKAIPQAFNRLRGVIWFNRSKEADWRLNSSRAALQAYRRIARMRRYRFVPY